MDTNTTRTLVSRAKTGDRTAFESLVAEYTEELRDRIGFRMGPQVRGKLEPEDVLQETFLRAFQSIEHFTWRGDASFLRWLQSIAENRIRDAVKGPRGERMLQLSDQIGARSPSPSTNLRRDERFDRLNRSLAHLSPDHREVILLSRIEGLKLRAVARRMDRSENAVKNLLLRALRELKSRFGDTASLGLPDRRLGEESDE